MNVKVGIYDSILNKEIFSKVFPSFTEAQDYVKAVLNLWVYGTFKPMSNSEIERLIDLDLPKDQIPSNAIGKITVTENTVCSKMPLLDHIYGLYKRKGDLGLYYVCTHATNDNVSTISNLEEVTKKCLYI